MSKYLIYMDVSGDIDEAYAKEKDLRFVPMEYSLGEEMRVSEGVQPDDIMKKFYDGQRNGDLTKTSQISPYMYEEYLDEAFKEGYSVLYLSLSSGLSSTYQSALMAKAELKEKYPEQDFYPVDSLAATGGMGVLIERAIRNKEAGMSIEDNYEDLVAATHKIKHYFMVQDLMYLKRGGRVSATTAVVGTMLNVKPILEINEEGKLITIAKKRGNKAAISGLVDYFKEHFNDALKNDVVYIVDADIKELGDLLADTVKQLYPDITVRRSTLSPIIGAHTGPGMVAVCFMGK